MTQQQHNQDPNIEESKIYLKLLMRVGLIMITSIAIGFGIGLYIETKFPSSGSIPLISLVIGIASGFSIIYKSIMKVIK